MPSTASPAFIGEQPMKPLNRYYELPPRGSRGSRGSRIRRLGGSLGLTGACLLLLGSAGCSRSTKPLVAETDYSDWQRTHEQELDYPVPGHENHYRIIRINPIGEKPEITFGEGEETRYQYPKGTVVVKEVYSSLTPNPGDDPILYTIMKKAPDHPEARDGWVYLTKSPADGEETVVQQDFCFRCHREAHHPHPYGWGNPRGHWTDYLFFPYPPAD